jgi:hypothetical protein
MLCTDSQKPKGRLRIRGITKGGDKIMLQPFGKFTSGLLVLTLLALLMVVPAPRVAKAQEAGPNAGEAGSEAYATWSGGAVKGKRAVTQTALTVLPEAATWAFLPGASITVAVPAQTTDLFNVAFSADCRLVGSVPPTDYVRIRILDTVGAVSTAIEPYDGDQAFCSANARATHKGNWAKRVQAGTHVLRVQFWILDGAPAGALSALIKDWTFEVVVYD